VCLYDRLGEGRSDSAPDTQTFASLAEDLDGGINLRSDLDHLDNAERPAFTDIPTSDVSE
jgi:hypothetical protein